MVFVLQVLVIAAGFLRGDIEPDEHSKTLTLKIHRTASPAHDKALGLLLADLTDQAFCHPETAAKMIFHLV